MVDSDPWRESIRTIAHEHPASTHPARARAPLTNARLARARALPIPLSLLHPNLSLPPSLPLPLSPQSSRFRTSLPTMLRLHPQGGSGAGGGAEATAGRVRKGPRQHRLRRIPPQRPSESGLSGI